MKVAVLPENAGGTGRYRLTWPAEFAAREGIETEVLPGLSCEWEYYPDHDIHLCRRVPVDADVLVVQRCLTADMPEVIRQAQAQGIAVVVDIDDDFEHLPVGHAGRQVWDIERDIAMSPDHLRLCCELADLVTVSTPELARIYAPHGRFMVLRNCVPSRYFSVVAGREPTTTVGWTGSVDSHVRDLEAVGGGLRKALRGTDARFVVVGPSGSERELAQPDVAAQLRLDRVASSGWVGFDFYPDWYARLDVAICPLATNAFNRSKSWLKVLEAASLGVACVASPSPDYLHAAEQGLCDIARTPTEWARKVRRLIDDVDAREEQAYEQRAAARAWTYEANAWRWVEAWDQALEFSTARKEAA